MLGGAANIIHVRGVKDPAMKQNKTRAYRRASLHLHSVSSASKSTFTPALHPLLLFPLLRASFFAFFLSCFRCFRLSSFVSFVKSVSFCLSVCPSVCRSVDLSVGRSVGPVCQRKTHLKNTVLPRARSHWDSQVILEP